MSDVISRRDAVEVIRECFDKNGLNPDICIDGIMSLPDIAQGEENRQHDGKTVYYAERISKVSTDDDYAGWTCPNCGKFYVNSKPFFYKYCPECGALYGGRHRLLNRKMKEI